MKISIFPLKCETRASAIVTAHVGERMLALIPMTLGGLRRREASNSTSMDTDWIRGMLVGSEQVPRTAQPRDARFIATARPMPRDAPVTTATLPSKSCDLCNRGVMFCIIDA